MRLGDLDALEKAIKDELNYARSTAFIKTINKRKPVDLVYAILDIIDTAPTVEINTNDIEYKAYCKGLEDGKKIARPQGEPQMKWVKIFENSFTNGYVCPFCGHEIHVTEQFLPKVTECEGCGADMVGGTDNDR